MTKALLQTAVDQWFEHREAEGIAHNTIRAETTTLRAMVTSVGNIYVENVNGRHIDKLMRELAKTRSPNTRRLDHSILDKFFRWCADTGLSQRYHNPMVGHRKPRQQQREHRHLHVSKFPALLDAATNPRNRAFLALSLYLFTRQSETSGLKVRDVDLQAGSILVWQPKSQREDRMPISTELSEELQRWLTHYTTECGVPQPDWHLVPAYTRSVFTGPSVRVPQKLAPSKPFLHPERVVQDALMHIGFLQPSGGCKSPGQSQAAGQHEGCHTLRRSGARALFDTLLTTGGTYDGAGRTVQAMLHHKSFDTTEHYLGMQLDKERRDSIIRGKSMFPNLTSPEVVSLPHEGDESVTSLRLA